MERQQKQQEIFKVLAMQNALFNPAACPGGTLDFEYVFKEDEGDFVFHLSIRGKKSQVVEGSANQPVCVIESTLATLGGVMNGEINPLQAIQENRLKIKGDALFFRDNFRKIYSGTTQWDLPDHLYKGAYEIDQIKKVFVLNCSPRGEKGATALVTEHFVAGMQKAGAQVETLYLSKLKINPCLGCFQCWVNNTTQCVYHSKDDMKIILEKYWTYDLLVWATPIYHYHGTTAMKTVMDRLFINADPHFIEVDGQYRHPRKVEHIPYYALLAVGGFPAMNIFEPLKVNFQTLSAHTGIRLIGELYRHTSMAFIADGFKFHKRQEVLDAIEAAGMELVTLKKIKDETKRLAEQDIAEIPMLASMVNMNMDIMQREKRMLFQRKGTQETM